MFSRPVLILLLAAVAQARASTETQGALVKGSVILNGEGGPGVANVQITDSAHTGGPWATGSDGGFTLDFPNRAPDERVRLGVIKDGYVIVNWVQLDLALPKDLASSVKSLPNEGASFRLIASSYFSWNLCGSIVLSCFIIASRGDLDDLSLPPCCGDLSESPVTAASPGIKGTPLVKGF
jgi:hypothetical protein